MKTEDARFWDSSSAPPRYRRRSMAVLLIAGLLVAGCDDLPVTSVAYKLEDIRSFAVGVLGRGPMLVVVSGYPHDVPAVETEAAVLTALPSATAWIAEPRFTTDPQQAANPSYRLLVTFNAAPPDPCGEDTKGGEPQPAGRIELTMTFCSGTTVLSKVRGRIGRTDGVGDKRFARLIRQAAVDLFMSEHSS